MADWVISTNWPAPLTVGALRVLLATSHLPDDAVVVLGAPYGPPDGRRPIVRSARVGQLARQAGRFGTVFFERSGPVPALVVE